MRSKTGWHWFAVHCCYDSIEPPMLALFDLFSSLTIGLLALLCAPITRRVAYASFLALVIMSGYFGLAGIGAAAAGVPRERLLGTINYKRNGFNELLQTAGTLPGEIYDQLILRFTGTHQKNMTLAPTVVTENPFTLLKSIQTRFGGNAWNDVPGTDLRVLNMIHSRRGLDSPNIVQTTNVAIENKAISFDLYLPFRFDDMVDPRVGMWPVNRYKNAGLRINWGTETDLITEAGVVTTDNLDSGKVDVYGRVWTGEDAFEKRADLRLYARQQQVWDANNTAWNQKRLQIPNDPSLLRGILIKQYTDSPETPITSLISDTQEITLVYNNSDRKYEYTWGYLRSMNQWMYGGALPAGYVYIDLADDGDFARLQDTTNGVYEIIVTSNAVANAKLRTTYERYLPAVA